MKPRVVVIGAGMAGASCAERLYRAGVDVAVVEKGRGPGGRMSTRRMDTLAFDHGAPAFAATREAFADVLHQWAELGWVAGWVPPWEDTPHWTGTPSMNRVCQSLLQGVSAHYGRQVSDIAASSGLVEVRFDKGPVELANAVVCTAPAPQAQVLLEAWESLRAPASRVRYRPTWAAMMAFSGAPFGEADHVALQLDGAPIGHAWCDGLKPGRDGRHTWVIHANDQFSAAHLERSPQEMADIFLTSVSSAPGFRRTRAVLNVAHRWRYARPENPLGSAILQATDLPVIAAGDWVADGGVAGAWMSGTAAAMRVLELLGK